jgi:hypothetical protein
MGGCDKDFESMPSDRLPLVFSKTPKGFYFRLRRYIDESSEIERGDLNGRVDCILQFLCDCIEPEGSDKSWETKWAEIIAEVDGRQPMGFDLREKATFASILTAKMNEVLVQRFGWDAPDVEGEVEKDYNLSAFGVSPKKDNRPKIRVVADGEVSDCTVEDFLKRGE